MYRSLIFIFLLVTAGAASEDCSANPDGTSTCPGADQTALLQGRVNLATQDTSDGNRLVEKSASPVLAEDGEINEEAEDQEMEDNDSIEQNSDEESEGWRRRSVRRRRRRSRRRRETCRDQESSGVYLLPGWRGFTPSKYRLVNGKNWYIVKEDFDTCDAIHKVLITIGGEKSVRMWAQGFRKQVDGLIVDQCANQMIKKCCPVLCAETCATAVDGKWGNDTWEESTECHQPMTFMYRRRRWRRRRGPRAPSW